MKINPKKRINEVIFDLLTEYRDKVALEAKRLKYEHDNDPRMEIFNVNREFAIMLDENQGAARSTKDFESKAKFLYEREKAAKKRAEKYDMVKICNEFCDMEVHLSNINHELGMMKFRDKNLKGRE